MDRSQQTQDCAVSCLVALGDQDDVGLDIVVNYHCCVDLVARSW